MHAVDYVMISIILIT